jgi:hypothetical protein
MQKSYGWDVGSSFLFFPLYLILHFGREFSERSFKFSVALENEGLGCFGEGGSLILRGFSHGILLLNKLYHNEYL